MIDWFFATLRQYPEIAIFLTLAIGFYFGKFKFKGIGLGAVTATLLAGVLIGQLGIPISQPLKATVFLLFLFAVGYGVGRAGQGARSRQGRRRRKGRPMSCDDLAAEPFTPTTMNECCARSREHSPDRSRS